MRKNRALFLMLTAFVMSTNRAHAETHYAVVNGWPQLPSGTILGDVSGVALDSKGDVFIVSRAENSFASGDLNTVKPISSNSVIAFDRVTGKVSSLWGAGLFKMPHGLRIDGEDNVWVTDIILQQVFKFSRTGKLLLKVGTADILGCDATHFNGPTDIAVLPDGSFYVADGYGSSRIAKFSADGRFEFSWGRCATAPMENLTVYLQARSGAELGVSKPTQPVRKSYDGPADFNTPHSIIYDPVDRLLYVADRDNARIQVFGPDGRHVRTLKSEELGRPWALAMGPDRNLYVVDGGDLSDGPEGGLEKPYREAIMKVSLNGKVLSKWSGFGNQNGNIYWGHDIAVDRDGAVYVGDVSYGMRIQKFVLSTESRH